MLRLATGLAVILATLIASRVSDGFDLMRFPLAWWGIVLALDGAVRVRHRWSPFATPGDLLACALASVAFWDVFELLNLRLHDWWYVGVPRNALAGAAFSAISYATVLPAVRLALALLAPAPGAERIAAAPAPGKRARLAAAGIAMLAAALAVPDVAFPFAWIFLWPLCESLVAGIRDETPAVASPLQALRAGRRDLPLRALALGLPFGLTWESLNWRCARGWIYTVPHFERPKLFEMPVAGYLGYLPFLLESAAALAIVERLRPKRGRAVLAAVCIAALHLGTEALSRPVTVLSVAQLR
jgi:hypothetical protein